MTSQHATALGLLHTFFWVAKSFGLMVVAATTLNESAVYLLVAVAVYAVGKIGDILVNLYGRILAAKESSCTGKLAACQELLRERDAELSRVRGEVVYYRTGIESLQAEVKAERAAREDMRDENRMLTQQLADALRAQSEVSRRVAENSSAIVQQALAKPAGPVEVKLADTPIPVVDVHNDAP